MKTHDALGILHAGLAACLVVVAGCSGCTTPDPGTLDSGLGIDASLRDARTTIDALPPDAPIAIDGNGFDVNAPPPDTNAPDMSVPLDDTNAPMDANADAFTPDLGFVPFDAPGRDGNGFDAGPPGCFPAMCQGHQYACGDCVDNDLDGLIDSQDPDCLNQCGNNELGWATMIPGMGATCSADCYFDQDSGSGNDHCVWDYRCDPLGPDRNPAASPSCDYSASFAMAHPSQCPNPQPAACLSGICARLTPFGCDCFGCCQLPDTGQYIFLGSLDANGQQNCSPTTAHDPTVCRPCTPQQSCLNPCAHCELCFGRTTLPADCFPPPPVDASAPNDANVPDAPFPDGAHPDAYVPPVDAYVPPNDAYVPPRCPGISDGPCGLPTDPPCLSGDFCISGCCQFFG